MASDPTKPQPAALPNTRAIPPGYVAIPVHCGQEHAPLRICALCRLEADPLGGHLVVLRDHVDARIFLGCVVDAAGRLHQWVELWVQWTDRLSVSPAVVRDALSNAVLDHRWRQHCDALESLEPSLLIRTGWETEHPHPTWLDLGNRTPVHPIDASSGQAWRLCTDENALKDNGLPGFIPTLHRYLYLKPAEGNSVFIPVTAGAPATGETRPIESLEGKPKSAAVFNAGAGLLMVRHYSPLGLEEFFDLLSGAPMPARLHGSAPLPIDIGVPPEGAGGQTADWLFMGRHGQWGRLLEAFHLKLRLLADSVATVRTLVERTQRPLLNLEIDHFRVHLGDTGQGLPRLWTARSVLVEPGAAVELPVRTSDTRYYLPGQSAGHSIYRPAKTDATLRGRGAIRIRKLLADAGGATIVEGTFSSQERIEPASHDLIWLRIPVAEQAADLYAHLEAEPALARGEWRFRTTPQRLSEPLVARLRAAEGVPLTEVPFDLLPLLSSPCDLYSLAVIAVRGLLVNSQTLPVALDEVVSLAGEVARGHDPSIPLCRRISAIFDLDQRWHDALGPQRLSCEPATVEQALDLVPPQLWWDTLAMIVVMLPGVGPDSVSADFGDARVGGLHRVFDRTLADLENLIIRTRSLIVIDWRYNREIHAVIRERQVGLAGKPPTAHPVRSNPSSP